MARSYFRLTNEQIDAAYLDALNTNDKVTQLDCVAARFWAATGKSEGKRCRAASRVYRFVTGSAVTAAFALVAGHVSAAEPSPRPALVWQCTQRPLEQGGSPTATNVIVCGWVKQ